LGLPRGPAYLTVWRDPIYAVIKTGGRQYRVEPDQTLDVARLIGEAGATVEFEDVLMLEDDDDVRMGTPLVTGARVIAEVIEHGRDAKVLVFKYKGKTRYRRRKGHRQAYTRVAIREILTDGRRPTETDVEKPARASRRRSIAKREESSISGEAKPITEAASSPSAEVPTIEGKARSRRTSQTAKDSARESGTAEPKPARRPRVKKTESGE
jgi:large subunit ribosomal protein L21